MEDSLKISDILLVEEESSGPVISVKCDSCGNSGFQINNNIARQCPDCKDERIKAIRRSRLNNIPIGLRRFPIKFDVPVTMEIFGRNLESVSTISSNEKVEEKLNIKIFKLLDNGNSLFIFGSPGSGKTMVSCGIAVKYIDDGKQATFVLASELFDLGFSQTENFQQQKPIFNSEILIIDDLGAEFLDSKRFKSSFFHKVLSARMSRKKPMIITSNYKPNDLRGHYGNAVAKQITDNFICFSLFTENFKKKLAGNAAQALAED